MIYPSRTIRLRDGREATLRAPDPQKDAVEMNAFLKTCAAETEFILRYPEECTITDEQEAAYLQALLDSPDGVMIVCEVEGEIAGNSQLTFNSRLKTRHRAEVAVGLKRKFWGLGIGTALFEEMIALARQRGVSQIELDYLEGNERGRRLYEKMGFRSTGETPDAYRLKDGTSLKGIHMIKAL